MRWSIVATVVRREAMEIVRNRLLVFSIVLPPVLLIAVPLLVGNFAGADSTGNIPPDLLKQLLASHPEWAGLTRGQLVAAFTLQQFLIIFLIMPAYVPLSIATFSIVGEKQSRSLEAVLATPIRTSELLTGKAIASVVPGVLTSWLAYLVLLGLAALLLGPALSAVLADASWLAAVVLLGPVVGLLSCVAGIIVSSRVNDPRVAQQIGGVVILPIVGIAIAQAIGGVLFGPREFAIAALVLGLVGVSGVFVAAWLFDRETILTRWR